MLFAILDGKVDCENCILAGTKVIYVTRIYGKLENALFCSSMPAGIFVRGTFTEFTVKKSVISVNMVKSVLRL